MAVGPDGWLPTRRLHWPLPGARASDAVVTPPPERGPSGSPRLPRDLRQGSYEVEPVPYGHCGRHRFFRRRRRRPVLRAMLRPRFRLGTLLIAVAVVAAVRVANDVRQRAARFRSASCTNGWGGPP